MRRYEGLCMSVRLVRTSLIFALLTEIPAAQDGDFLRVESTITKMMKGQTKILDRCFYEQFMYVPFWNYSTVTANHTDCQQKCLNLEYCKFFTFFRASGTCRFTGKKAVYRAATDQEGMTIAGPEKCPAFPSGCMAMPGPGFPGDTIESSASAWPMHRVPQNLECWPKDWEKGIYRQCKTFKTLENYAKGWPGKCQGMSIVLVPHLETCESYCKKKLTCSAFQVAQNEKPFGPKTCWHADLTAGLDCYERRSDPDFEPLSAKRFMRGNARVLMDIRGVAVKGLINVFPETYWLNVHDAATACRYHCYSNLLCQYWQYYLESGCWVEDPLGLNGQQVPYPPTTSSWLVGTKESRTVLAGEYIQHVCFEPGEPGKQVEAKWELKNENVTCAEDVRKNLGGTGGNLEACKELTIAEAACGKFMYSDGWQCSCILSNEACDPKWSADTQNSLYYYKLEKRVPKIFKKLKEKVPNITEKAKEIGMQTHVGLSQARGDWKSAQFMKVSFTIDGLHYDRMPRESVNLVGDIKSAIAEALHVQYTEIKDLKNNPDSITLLKASQPHQTKASFFLVASSKATHKMVKTALQKDEFAISIADVVHKDAASAANKKVAIVDVAVSGTNAPGTGEPRPSTTPSPRPSPAPSSRRRHKPKSLFDKLIKPYSTNMGGLGAFLILAAGAVCLCCTLTGQVNHTAYRWLKEGNLPGWGNFRDEDDDSSSNASSSEDEEMKPAKHRHPLEMQGRESAKALNSR